MQIHNKGTEIFEYIDILVSSIRRKQRIPEDSLLTTNSIHFTSNENMENLKIHKVKTNNTQQLLFKSIFHLKMGSPTKKVAKNKCTQKSSPFCGRISPKTLSNPLSWRREKPRQIFLPMLNFKGSQRIVNCNKGRSRTRHHF